MSARDSELALSNSNNDFFDALPPLPAPTVAAACDLCSVNSAVGEDVAVAAAVAAADDVALVKNTSLILLLALPLLLILLQLCAGDSLERKRWSLSGLMFGDAAADDELPPAADARTAGIVCDGADDVSDDDFAVVVRSVAFKSAALVWTTLSGDGGGGVILKVADIVAVDCAGDCVGGGGDEDDDGGTPSAAVVCAGDVRSLGVRGELADDSLRPNGVGGWPDVGDGIVKVAVTDL